MPVTLRLLLLGFFLATAPVSFAQTLTGRDLDRMSGEELYRGTCAGCHGADGRGIATEELGFGVEVPDFSECSFATPETEADWVAVVMEGGPVRAFSRKMPAFGDLLTVDQATRIVEYVRGLCQEESWPRGELNLPRPQVTEKAFPENEAVVASTLTRNPGLAETEFVYEHRVGSRGQWEVILPFIVRQQLPGDWGRGLGDIKLAYKHVIAQSASDGAIFSLAGEMKLPTGKEDQGFGGGQTVAEAYAAFGKILPRDMFLHLQAGAERPITRSPAVAEAFWRGAFGKTYAQDRGFGRTWSPMVELLGARELTAGTRVEWDVVPQMQVSLSKRQHVLISAGYRFPVNDANQRQGAFMVYLLWDWFDGGFFSGWK